MEKTYKVTIEKPRLEIYIDNFARNPREDRTNLGYFYTADNKTISPDGTDSEIYNIMVKTGDEADNAGRHMELMKSRIEQETGEKVLAIYPVYKHEHGNTVYRRGTAHGFDDSNNGFYIVTDKSAEETGADPKDFENWIDQELEVYTNWANGEVYGVRLFDEDGEEFDGQGELYSLEDVRAGFPPDFAEAYKDDDLTQYIV